MDDRFTGTFSINLRIFFPLTSFFHLLSRSQQMLLLFLQLPSMKAKVDSEMAKATADIERSLVPTGPSIIRHLVLPLEGRTPDSIQQEMEKLDKEIGGAERWQAGKLSGAVYHGGKDLEVNLHCVRQYMIADASCSLQEVIMNAMSRYAVSNPLHPDVFPGNSLPSPHLCTSHANLSPSLPVIRKMEAEIVSMCLRLWVTFPTSLIHK